MSHKRMRNGIPDTLLRNGNYQFKKRIPKHLISTTTFGGKTVYQKTLNTSDPREARRRASDMDEDFKALCHQAELELSGRKPSLLSAIEVARCRTPSEEEIQAELGREKNAFLSRHHRGHDTRNNAAFGAFEGEIFSGSPEHVWIDKLQSLHDEIVGTPNPVTVMAVKRIIQNRRWHVEENSPLFLDLCQRFAANELEAIETLMNSPKGDYHRQYQTAPRKDASSLVDAMAHYGKIKGARTQMLKKIDTAIRAWDDLIGKQTIALIDRGDIRRFIAELEKVPMKLRAQRPNESLRKLIDDPKSKSSSETRLAPRTIKDNYIAPLSAAINALKEDFPEVDNPFERVKVDGATRKSNKRSFKDHELNAIFQHPIFTGCHSIARRNQPGRQIIKDHYYWAPIIAMWTGMRAGEIANLKVGDVRMSSLGYLGKPHFWVSQGKTQNARREVPLHPRLLEFGFDQYVAGIVKNGETRLFPEWQAPKGKLISNAASQKNFNTKVILCCDDNTVSFHTFRHTMKDTMARARIPEQYQNAILGHEQAGRNADYLHPKLDDYADEFYQLVDFKAVDLSHLKV